MSAAEEREKQRRHSHHQQNLARAGEQTGETVSILQSLSEVDDLPIDPESDPVMGQMVSRLSSTANLTAEQVRSNEWVREYLFVLYLCRFPRDDGLHGTRRAWAHANADEDRQPLKPERRTTIEAFVSSSKLALTRSKDFRGVREAVRSISESLVHDDGDDGGGGLLGIFK